MGLVQRQVGQVVVERGEHRVAALAVHAAEGVDLALPVGGLQVLAHDVLGERARAEHRALVRQDEFLSDRVRSERPADAEARGERLRERAEVDDAVLLDRAHRVRRRAVEVQQAVGVVLEHEDAVGPADLEDLESALPRERHAGRVRVVRDRVQELDPLAGLLEARDVLAQRLGDEAELIHRHVLHVGLVRLEHDHRGHVARALGDHDVARVDEQLRDELEGVLRAGGDDDVIHTAPDALERHHLEDVLTQRRRALAGAVLQRLRPVVAHDALHRRLDELLRQGGHERHATGERHDLGPGCDGEQGAHLAGGEAGGALGVAAVPRVEVVALRVSSVKAMATQRKGPAPEGTGPDRDAWTDVVVTCLPGDPGETSIAS